MKPILFFVPVHPTASPRLTSLVTEPNQKWLNIVEDFCNADPRLTLFSLLQQD